MVRRLSRKIDTISRDGKYRQKSGYYVICVVSTFAQNIKDHFEVRMAEFISIISIRVETERIFVLIVEISIRRITLVNFTRAIFITVLQKPLGEEFGGQCQKRYSSRPFPVKIASQLRAT